MSAIAISNLCVSYGSHEVVSGFTLSVGRGELVGLLGPNGAGKSTTLSVLTSGKRYSQGTVLVDGLDLRSPSLEARRNIGVIFQESTLDRQLTALQNLKLHGLAYGMRPDVVKVRGVMLLQMLELWGRRDDYIDTYSGGMRRRLELARALLHDPSTLVLDEPTTGLDPQTRLLIWEHLEQLRQNRGLTILLATHDMGEAERCGRIAVIDHGTLIAEGSPSALKSRIGMDVISVAAADPPGLMSYLRSAHGVQANVSDGLTTFAMRNARSFIKTFLTGYPGHVDSVQVREPRLDDVFISLTGRSIRGEAS